MPKFDVVRDVLYDDVNRGGERMKNNLPNWLERAIEGEVWKEAVNPATGEPYKNIGEWLIAFWPMGPAVGSNRHSITYDELIMLCEHRPKLKDLLVKHRPKGKHGGDRKSDKIKSDNVTLDTQPLKRGNSRAYLEDRLQREFPKIWRAYLNGEYKSARQAGIAAGFIKDTHDPLMRLKTNWTKATKQQRKEFRKWLNGEGVRK